MSLVDRETPGADEHREVASQQQQQQAATSAEVKEDSAIELENKGRQEGDTIERGAEVTDQQLGTAWSTSTKNKLGHAEPTEQKLQGEDKDQVNVANAVHADDKDHGGEDKDRHHEGVTAVHVPEDKDHVRKDDIRKEEDKVSLVDKDHRNGVKLHDNEAKHDDKDLSHHTNADKDLHSAPTDGGRDTEEAGNGSEFGSNDGSTYSSHKIVLVYSPPTKRGTGGGNGKPRGSMVPAGSAVKFGTTKSQKQQQHVQGRSQLQTKPPPVVARLASPQRSQTTDRPISTAAGVEPSTNRSARSITATANNKVGGGTANNTCENNKGNQATTPKGRRDGASGSDAVSEDDTNIYKTNLQQAKQELNQMKEHANEVQNARRQLQERRLGRSSKKSECSSFHFRPLDDFDCSRSYCDTQVLDFYIKKDATHRYYPVAKATATSLLDPWDDLAQQRPAERVKRSRPYQQPHNNKQRSRPQSRPHQTRDGEQSGDNQQPHPRQPLSGADDGTSPRRRTARLPIVDFSATAEYWRRPLYFDELPVIRSRIKEAHSSSGRQRREMDYARTAEECRSLELDSIDRVPGRRNRTNLARCCSAYMGTRPGSRAALGDCLERVRHCWAPASDEPEQRGESRGSRRSVVQVSSASGRRSRQQKQLLA